MDKSQGKFTKTNVIRRWEYLKFDIREFAREFSIQRAKNRRNKINKLEAKINSCHKKLNMINLKAQNAVKLIEKVNVKLDELKIELDKETRYEIQGVMLRTRIRWVEQGEKNTKYFFALEKSKSKSKSMRTICTQNGEVTHDPREVLKYQEEFYQQLYKEDSSIVRTLESIPGTKLDVTQCILLDSEITLEEISEALKEMPRNKAPGPDGIPADFYKVFWIKIKGLIHEVFSKCRENGILFDSARQGIISLIPKEGRNRSFLKNWRPITLLNVDYKILSKTMANRMKIVLPDIIDRDQTGFVKGKDISENLRKVFDVIELALIKKMLALIVQVDFEKAFDRVDLKSLFLIMEKFNFGENMISWTKILFKEFNLAVTNFSYLSHFFVPTRGLFQGNLIVLYLFLLIGEVLARQLKQNNKVEGIKVGLFKALLTQFADDLTLFLKFKESVWQAVMDTFNSFERLSGMKISYEKTKIYRIGSIRNSQAKFYSKRKIIWTNELIRVLGVWIVHSL